jgi:Fe-S-cluster containining protein
MSKLLSCPRGHRFWQPFSDEPASPVTVCPRCGARVETAWDLAAAIAAAEAAPRREPPPAPPQRGNGRVGLTVVPPGDVPADPRPPPEMATAALELSLLGARLRAELQVPAGPTRPDQLLPVFRALAETIVGLAVQRVEKAGQAVSCKKGCAACCRQLAPLTEPEAWYLRDLVEGLPEPRRSEVRARFDEVRRLVQEAGLRDKLLQPEDFPPEQLQPVGLEYFALDIPCPFLEHEACSIYPERPLTCREYLVTSPAENCSRLTTATVRHVPLPGRVSTAVANLDRDPPARRVPWVPLSLALEWAATHPQPLPAHAGPELMRDFFLRLTGKEIPLPRLPGMDPGTESSV